MSLSSHIESVLFVAGEPISFSQLSECLDRSREDIEQALFELTRLYQERGAGLRIIVHNDDVQMVTHPDSSGVLEKFTKRELDHELSKASLEILTIIAYRGPISRYLIDAIRGVNSRFTLRTLLKRGLIEQHTSLKAPHQVTYGVTMDLLHYFGIASVEELPNYSSYCQQKKVTETIQAQLSEERKDIDAN